MRSPRALISIFACLLVILASIAGIGALLAVLPLAGIVVLLLSGRYVGENRILRWHATPVRITRRIAARPLRPRPTWARSIHARSPLSRRGPPAGALA
jgi:hypothetical protein